MQNADRVEPDKALLEENWRQGLMGDHQALSALCAAAKDARAAALLLGRGDKAALTKVLDSPAPKARKNCARLMGTLGWKGYGAPLYQRALAEDTLFVLPSIALALGNCGGTAEQLAAILELLPGETSDNAKHLTAAREACRLALAKAQPGELGAFSSYTGPLVLRAPGGCGELLAREAAQKGIAGELEGDELRLCGEYTSFFTLRCFAQALIPLGVTDKTEGALLEEISAWGLDQRLAALYGGRCAYRIELQGVEHGDRGPMARAIAALHQTPNSPSSYNCELRLERENGVTKGYIRLFSPEDTRFAYRKKALPASIHPATAACVARFAQPYLVGGEVADVCCGSGTLLIERGLLGPCALYGSDIDKRAVAAARENFEAAGLKCALATADLRAIDRGYDEVWANLPFGSRVMNGDRAKELTAELVTKLSRGLMNKKGIAVLYTTQRLEVENCCRRLGLRVLGKHRFIAGGIRPWVLVVGRKG